MMNNESVVRIDKPSITYEGPKWNSLIEGSPNGMLTYGNCLSCGRSGPVGLPCQCGLNTYAVLLLCLGFEDSAAINAEFLSKMLGCGHEAAGGGSSVGSVAEEIFGDVLGEEDLGVGVAFDNTICSFILVETMLL